MNILLTGASSLTGCWIARTLALRGHAVYATFQGSPASYTGMRKKRVDSLPDSVVRLWGTSLQSEALLGTILDVGHWDLLCLHGAYVTNYRSPDFDPILALTNNVAGLPRLLATMRGHGSQRVLATGTAFEADEGTGEEPHRAFSPYGLSKTLSWHYLRYLTAVMGLTLGKYVISNPFGPMEEPRFTAYLMNTWFEGKVAEVKTPDYIRDNIHVTRLAEHYADFVESTWRNGDKCAPMGYVESQGAFAQRFAFEMRKRLGWPCEVELRKQATFDEPFMRVNTQQVSLPPEKWSEVAAWDELAAWYSSELSARR